MPQEKRPFQRLPLDVVPKNYDLKLSPDLAKLTFTGKEKIDVKVVKACSKIILNSVDIDIHEAYFEDAQKIAADVSYSKEDETATLTFASELPTGNSGKLCMDFTGELNDKMKGFYRSKYFTPSNEERMGAVTQFESTDARRAFPCWDEPAVKATFDVTLCVPTDRVALSNMPVRSEYAESAGLKEVTFERTPIMSTYLLAFVVGEYDYIETTDADGVLVRVYTPVGKQKQGEFALEVAAKTLPFYKNYFNIAYPLPKIDLIAIADFAAGAMENWGLVTYRETALLVDPKNSSSVAKQWVALVVGHELAHQWFGNLVTMEWWTHLWLNEGFASWIEYLCVDFCFPEYDIWTQFVTSDYVRALQLDALNNSHPIEVPVGHPAEVDEIFDAISYSKGASIIRMLHNWIGDKDFSTGMHNYLTKHKYSNTYTEDLWASLEQASGQPVNKVMSTWTKQMGYPVLKVSSKQEGNNRILTVTQQKFCAGARKEGESESTAQWFLPVSVSSAASPDKAMKTFVMDKKTMTVTLENVPASDWIKLNPGTVGVYRTQYSSEMLELLISAIRNQSLPARDRLGLQNDLFALARAGEASTVDALKLLEAFSSETNYTVWQDIAGNLAQLSTLLQYTDYYPLVQKYNRDLFSEIAHKLGWTINDGESHLNAMLRGLVLCKLGRNDDQEVIAESERRFKLHVDNTERLNADLRSAVYQSVLSKGDEHQFEQMLKLIKEADLHEEKLRIMRSLGAVKEVALIERVLQFAMSDEVRSQDTVFVIGSVGGSAVGRKMAWKFIQENFKELHSRYQGGFLLARLVKFGSEDFATEEMAQQVENFFAKQDIPAAERTVQQSVENIRLNASWLKREQQNIKDYLAARP